MELVINFSGGKDSSAMLAYLCEKYQHIRKHVVFADTGWEHEDAEVWGRSIVARFGLPLHIVRNPNKDFIQMVRRRGKFPSPSNRQCTSELKRGPIQTWIRRNITDPVVINCMGMRSEEGPARAKKRKLSRDKTQTNSRRTIWNWLPIHDWTEKQVREYLAERNIPLHPVYRFLNRFSCRVCIYMTKRDLTAVSLNDPVAFQRIVDITINYRKE
jgi:3'-phosphoadenosine 5'-phosphosulfate sulfotransferase (PAPS reductase)/FAD synthetase